MCLTLRATNRPVQIGSPADLSLRSDNCSLTPEITPAFMIASRAGKPLIAHAETAFKVAVDILNRYLKYWGEITIVSNIRENCVLIPADRHGERSEGG